MKSGSYNELSIILEKDNLFIIPDLQRDYCWGNIRPEGKNKTLAHVFCSEFVEIAKKSGANAKTELSYGIIYTYEYPETFFYISDGQQRLSTLYLIIGVLNSYLNDDRLKKLLVSKYNQPRLKYEVRSSTDYFINDLVQHVFLSNDSKVLGNLKKASWFRDEFEYDPSVNSMVEAIKSVHSIIQKADATLLADFIVQSVGFVWINLKTNDNLEDDSYTKVREYGEKMYEIVNTSGDPMEPNEHEKVHLLSRLAENEKEDWTEKWEVWQDFFWQHKAENQESADEGFNEFLDWIEKINVNNGKSESQDKLSEIEGYFKALFLWYNLQKELNIHRNAQIFDINKKLNRIDANGLVVVLPTLLYLKGTESVTYERNSYIIRRESVDLAALFRFIRFFSNISKNTQQSSICVDLVVKLKSNYDVVNLSLIKGNKYSAILSEEEIYKLNLYKESDTSTRMLLEDTFWQAEDNELLFGKIEPVFHWIKVDYGIKGKDSLDVNVFLRRYKAFTSLFENEERLELVRLFMLCLSDTWNEFHEGWSWNTRRYYLLVNSDREHWRRIVRIHLFSKIVSYQYNHLLNEAKLDELISSVEDSQDRKIIIKIKEEGYKYWQWNNTKRFFIHNDQLCLPNGKQAKAYTVKLKLD